MKVFINKLKKSNKPLLIIFIISLVVYIATYITFTINILHLSTIETLIRIIALIAFFLWIVFYLLTGLVSLFTKKYKSLIITLVFTIIFIVLFCFSSYYINAIYSEIDNFSKDKVTYTSTLLTLKDYNFTKSSKIGMINDTSDVEGYILGNKLIKNNDLRNKIEQYDNYYVMLSDLYNKKIDAIILSGNYGVLFTSEAEFENLVQDTKEVYKYSEEMKNQDNISYTSKKMTEPFTILLMGVDSTIDGLNPSQAFNGDTLMLITFNPKTLTASVFSVPRDTYVPISCRNNAYAKINSTAASGTSCVIKTLNNLTGIDIDYYVKINFKGVVDLVNTLGGIEVDVEAPYFRYNNGIDYHGQVCEQNSNREFGSNMVCMDPGYQTLNGEQALAYARNRHQYLSSDLDRVLHQQQVVEALTKKLKTISTFDQFKNILSAVEKNIDTNMKSDQILSLYNVAKKVVVSAISGQDVSIQMNKTFLETYNLPVWTGYSTTSALGYYKGSMDEISKMMKINLEIEKEKPNKTFEIDYNEDYTSKFYGKNIRTNPQEFIMANLIGMSESEARAWCSENNLTVTVEKVPASSDNGYVSDQSIHVNTLINNISSITLYVNDTSLAPSDTEEKKEDNTTPEKKEDNTTPEKKEEDTIIDNKEEDELPSDDENSETTPINPTPSEKEETEPTPTPTPTPEENKETEDTISDVVVPPVEETTTE